MRSWRFHFLRLYYMVIWDCLETVKNVMFFNVDRQTLLKRLLIMQAIILLPLLTFSHRALYADGAHFFCTILSEKNVLLIDWPRQFAHDLTQFPVVLALRVFHLSHLTRLAYLWSLPLFLLPALCLAACYRLLSKNDCPELLPIVVIAFSFVWLNTSCFVISESHLAAAIYWLIFITLLTMNAPLSLARSGLLLFCSIACMRLYESFSVLGLLLLMTEGIVAYKYWEQWRKRERYLLAICGACYIISIVLAWYSILHPLIPSNRERLFAVIADLLHNKSFLLSSLFLLIFGAAVAYKSFCHRGTEATEKKMREFRSFGKFHIPAMLVIMGIAFGMLPLISEQFLTPWAHYPARILNLLIPAGFSVIILFVNHFRRKPLLQRTLPMLFGAAIFFSAWHFSFQAAMCVQWNAYLRTFTHELRNHHGIVNVYDTALRNYRFNWVWTYPTMSVILSGMDGKLVTTFIEDPAFRVLQSQEAFDPRNPASFPHVETYGITYTPEMLNPTFLQNRK